MYERGKIIDELGSKSIQFTRFGYQTAATFHRQSFIKFCIKKKTTINYIQNQNKLI